MSNPLDDVFIMGVEGDTYKELLNVAKKEQKSVNEVVSEALKKKIEDAKVAKESTERKLLLEG